MAFTTDDLIAIEKAIAGGTLRVRFGDREITYQSLDDLLKLRRQMRDELDGTAGTPRKRTYRLAQSGQGY